MTETVWMSSLFSNIDIGMKQGARSKFFGHEWNPASFDIPLEPDEVFYAHRRDKQGCALAREEMTEAIAVFDQKHFTRTRSIFMAGPFYAVKKDLAEVFSRFDLGDGGLYPLTVYEADLETPYPGEYFLLNFGARKNTLLPEQSRNVVKFVVDKDTGIQIWKVNAWAEEGDVALSSAALEGADLWVDEVLDNKLFMSDALAQALIEVGMKDNFRLQQCRVTGTAR